MIHRFEYAVKKQKWIGGGTRSVKFSHGSTVVTAVRFISSNVISINDFSLESNRFKQITQKC